MSRVALAMAAAMMLGSAAPAFAFDSAVWKAQAGVYGAENTRPAQRDAAIAALTPGTSRANVAVLLGKPDRDHGRDWVYNMGQGLVGGEYRLLVVNFDGDLVRRVSEVSSEIYVAPRK